MIAAPVATLEPDLGRVRLDLTLDPALHASFTVQRHRLTDNRITNVRTMIGLPVLGTQWQGYDYELPMGTPVTYLAVATLKAGGTETSADSAPPITWTTEEAWLKDLAVPDRSMVVIVTTAPDLSYPIDQGVYDVIGRRTPVVVSDVRGSARGTIGLATLSLDDRANLLAIVSTGEPILFQAPPEYGGQLYAAVAEVSEERVSRIGDRPARRFTLNVTEVDAPTIAVALVLHTYQEVLDVYATYGDVLVGETSYYDLLTGPGTAVEGTTLASTSMLAATDLASLAPPPLTPAMRRAS